MSEGEEAVEFANKPDNEKFIFLYTELRWLGATMKEILEGQREIKKTVWITAMSVGAAIVGAVLSYHIWPK